MDKKLKFILLIFPIILVSTYVYSLTVNPYENDVLDGSQLSELPTDTRVTSINCPVGTFEGHTDGVDLFGNFVATSVCFGEGIFDIYSCGESFVDNEGMVQTVTCTMESP